jgi:glycosyltransferase involved in cell wall biosynthesis
MHLLLFNLATDADDPILGFTTGWIRALAQRVEFVHVVTMRVGRFAVPDNVNVYSLGKEKGFTEPRRLFELYKILTRILGEDRIDVCFSHMNPLFTALAGPILKVRRIPIVTWYAHPKVTVVLRIAHRLSDRMVASVSTAYPYERDKLIAVGQGIDTDLFSPKGGELPDEPPLILCAGRLSPVKAHPTLLRAVALLRQKIQQPFRVVIVGDPATRADEKYLDSLHQRTKQIGLEETVQFEPAVSMKDLPSWYRRSTVHVNMTPTGFGDKVVWEALACARLCVAANEGFRETLGVYADKFLYPYGDAEQLAQRLEWALSLSRPERTTLGAYFRRQVESMHGLDRLAQNLVSIFNSVKHSQNTTGPAQAAKLS